MYFSLQAIGPNSLSIAATAERLCYMVIRAGGSAALRAISFHTHASVPFVPQGKRIQKKEAG
jgi:hypothetical protein